MKNKLFLIGTLSFIIILNTNIFAAKVLGSKEEADALSQKSYYSSVLDEDSLTYQIAEGKITSVENITQEQKNDDAADRFTAQKAVKSGNKYTNSWSNYNITFENKTNYANDYYDFNDSGTVYDFGLFFNDYSRLAVYYSRLSRDLNTVAHAYAPDSEVNDVVIAGHTFKHVLNDVKFPFGVEHYDYYLREIDGKLMVIECFYDRDDAIAPTYIDKFTKNT